VDRSEVRSRWEEQPLSLRLPLSRRGNEPGKKIQKLRVVVRLVRGATERELQGWQTHSRGSPSPYSGPQGLRINFLLPESQRSFKRAVWPPTHLLHIEGGHIERETFQRRPGSLSLAASTLCPTVSSPPADVLGRISVKRYEFCSTSDAQVNVTPSIRWLVARKVLRRDRDCVHQHLARC